jgi:uncharacterized protein (DUF362 family)
MKWKNRCTKPHTGLNPTSESKPEDSPGGITKLYLKWGQRSFLFTLICIVWLVWRVGTKPTRAGYPCAQFAAGQVVLFFGSVSIPAFGLLHKCIANIRQKEYMQLGRIVLVTLIVYGAFTMYQNYQENQLRLMGSGTIPVASLAASPLWLERDLEVPGQAFQYPDAISLNHAVVSFSHNPAITYGPSMPPYDQAYNPAYDFVWDTVERLELGSSNNPLDDLINPGDTVLIKPNWVSFGPGVYTRPEVVRPLIDMAVAGGATTIYVGDGAGGISSGETVMSSGNFTAMTTALDSSNALVNISTINLNKRDYGWRWVNLSDNSSFAGSEYTHADLGTGSGTLYGHPYYQASDNQSISPGGDVLGWYAVNDHVLEADVIINVSKMKTHQEMIATMSIKNLVGFTMSSTYDDSGHTERIAHHHYIETNDPPMEVNRFDNDIFWRAILDMNKIVLYADENGVLQPTQQRAYLNVVDGIEAMERSQHHEYGGGGVIVNRHVVLAGIDPVAVDAVGCRIMGYDYRAINSISKTNLETGHPIGTNDPEDIIVVGDEINNDISKIFEYNDNWDEYAVGVLPITDFTPPSIISVDRISPTTIRATINGGDRAYILYRDSKTGEQQVEEMLESGTSGNYRATVPSSIGAYRIIAQDIYFNTAQDEPQYISITISDTGADGIQFGTIEPATDNNIDVSADAVTPSLTITVESDSNANVNLLISGTDFSGPGTITVDNTKYATSYTGTQTALSATDTTFAYNVAPGGTVDIWHWLDVPGGTSAGIYTSTFTYRAEAAP